MIGGRYTRRQFLRGLGGATLALPFLPSLTTRAFAADPPTGPELKCFFGIGTEHGNVWAQNMYPDASLLTSTAQYAGHTIRHGPLSATVNGAQAVLSPVLTAASSVLTPSLLSKFNVLRGVDVPYRIGHHSGGYLGNFAGTVGNVTAGLDNTSFMAPTIDQVMAWSPNFYSATDLACRMTQRSFAIGSGALSWNWTSPAAGVGNVVTQPSQDNNIDMYRFLFDPGSALNGVDTFVVDRIKQSYDRLKLDPRLSKGDAQRLDAHVERMAEIERKLSVVTQMATPPAVPAVDSDQYAGSHAFPHDAELNRQYCGVMNDIIVAGMAAGVSRVGTWHQAIKFTNTLLNDWHGQVAHEGMGSDAAQQWTIGWNQGTFEHVMVDLAAKMDAVTMADGATLLDHSLIVFTQEAGQYTHHSGCVNMPLVTAGGAGGVLQTGSYIDYSNPLITYQDLATLQAGNSAIELEHPGLYYNQFLATVLQVMGVQKSEYEHFTDFSSGEPVVGYGMHHIDPQRASDYAAARAVMGDLLPIWAATV